VSAPGRDRPDAAASVVVKLGGCALESPGAGEQLADDLAALRGRVVLVHGGGAELSVWCRRLGLEPRFVDGLRATDAPTLEVAVAVLAGLANKRLVALLRAGGVDAVGLSALDGGIVEAEPHPDAGRLGAVGCVRAVRGDLIEESLARGRTPVLASIGACEGALLNLNADDLAAALAGALRADALVLLSDVSGLVLDGSLVPQLDLDELDAALAGSQVTGGMRPKLRAARAALARGVRRAHIAAWQGRGTLMAVLAATAPCTTIAASARARSAHV
jgi:acetylglutamate kinase